MKRHTIAALILTLLAASPAAAQTAAAPADLFDRVTHGYATSEGGVKIHYASLGSGPLVVMIHGFPDFWYSWRDQMAALADRFQVVAIDQRGYNLSDKPKGVESYECRPAGRRRRGRRPSPRPRPRHHRRTRLGRRGGVALRDDPSADDRAADHPQPAASQWPVTGTGTNAAQIKNSEYARNFQQKSPSDPTVFFGKPMTPQTLSGWVVDPAARTRYVEAFERSDFEAMLNYYKRNYPRTAGADAAPLPELPKVTMPVLMFHGLNDTALNADGLSGTWNWLEKDLTLVTVPGAGHFVQQDAADLVSATMRWWLTMRTGQQ